MSYGMVESETIGSATLDAYLRQGPNNRLDETVPRVSFPSSRGPAEYKPVRIDDDKRLEEVAPDKSILVPYLNPHDMTIMALHAREAVTAMARSRIPVVIFVTRSGDTLDHILRNQDRVYHVIASGVALAHEKDRTLVRKLWINRTEVFTKDVIGRIIYYYEEKIRTGNADRTDESNLAKLREIRGQMDTPLHIFVDQLRNRTDYPIAIGHDVIFNTYRYFQDLFQRRRQQVEERLNLKRVQVTVDEGISDYLARILLKRDPEDERYLGRVCSHASEKHRNRPQYVLGFPTGDKGFLFNESLKSFTSKWFGVRILTAQELVELLGRHQLPNYPY